ncbi:IclR family transcriptional regulator [Fodinisporobacter ferrooxydans]|uniref:IclR family transcriptional regulator n=1 Tax=Fodinisporobacter ferrooxydans TaxID=2901836 RepID=A0ABY4CN53_9BACL|nr:IclR family transcriptional regulator [Alicyclobacillaceae bacterium MYW30-H2]
MTFKDHNPDGQRNTAIDKTLSILEMVASTEEGIALAELAKRLDMPKSTVHRLMETLKSRDYVEYDPANEKYIVGLRAVEIGVSGLMNLESVDVAKPYLSDLALSTGETSFFAVYNNGEIVYLYKTEGTRSIRTTAQLGMRKPVHCTGLGKAILSSFSVEEVDKILNVKGMSKFTERTITSRREFHEELSRVRLNGYAVDREETEIGLTCFAVPIYNYTGRAIGGISIAGPNVRMFENQKAFVQKLKDAALHISRRLGFVPSMRVYGT